MPLVAGMPESFYGCIDSQAPTVAIYGVPADILGTETCRLTLKSSVGRQEGFGLFSEIASPFLSSG
jgi:hypothetical protein